MLRARVDEAALATLRKFRIFTSSSGEDRLRVGDVVTFDRAATVEPYSLLMSGYELPSIGSFSYSWSPVPFGASIGRYCSISWDLKIMFENHPTDFVSTSSFSYDSIGPIFASALADFEVSELERYPWNVTRPNRNSQPVIENDVWIGAQALLAKGITLGTGCVVGAGSVVTKSVPPYAIVGGNPARIIRMRFSDDIIEKLLASNWWVHRFTDFAKMRYDNPRIFLDQLEQRRDRGEIEAFSPPPLRWGQVFEDVT